MDVPLLEQISPYRGVRARDSGVRFQLQIIEELRDLGIEELKDSKIRLTEYLQSLNS
jgi:predicted methyltransferase